MKYSHKFSDAIHIMAYLEWQKGGDLSSKAIAGSVEANPSVVRKLMSDLRKAGLIQSRQGVSGAFLTREPQDISLLDIYEAVDMDHNLLHIDTKTNPKCVVGANIQETLNQAYRRIQKKATDEMARISLQDILDGIIARHNAKKTERTN